MGEGDTVPQWLHEFIEGTYLTKRCVCGIRRRCQSFFCVLCSVDHLCHKQFTTPGGQHFGHDKLQVRMGSRRYAVTDTDLKAYMDTKLVHKFIINSANICFLKATKRSGLRSRASTNYNLLRPCKTCGYSLKPTPTVGSFCSLECLRRGVSPAGSEDNEKDFPPSSTNKPDLQKGEQKLNNCDNFSAHSSPVQLIRV